MRSIAPSRYDAGTAYITVDAHQVNNRDPFIYRTTDYGATWKLIVNGIPKSMLSYAKVIYEDPDAARDALRWAPRTRSTSRSTTASCWQPLQNNLPHAPVSGIVVQEHFDDLVISTYGRGFWILDDIGALRELTPAVLRTARRTSSRRAPRIASADHGAVNHVRRSDRRREPAVRRVDQLLPATGRARWRSGDHLERQGRGRAHARTCPAIRA